MIFSNFSKKKFPISTLKCFSLSQFITSVFHDRANAARVNRAGQWWMEVGLGVAGRVFFSFWSESVGVGGKDERFKQLFQGLRHAARARVMDECSHAMNTHTHTHCGDPQSEAWPYTGIVFWCSGGVCGGRASPVWSDDRLLSGSAEKLSLLILFFLLLFLM